MGYSHIVLSPGPGLPQEAGNMPHIITELAPTHTLLGVCLGHQAIAQIFGANLYNLAQVMHGKISKLTLSTDPLFQGVPRTIRATRYHSWAVNRSNLPDSLKVLAQDEDGTIMALRHSYLPIWGVQFHPESVMTEHGAKIISNWISI